MQHASPEQSQNLLNKLRQCSRAGGQALLLFSDFGRQMSTLYLSAVHFTCIHSFSSTKGGAAGANILHMKHRQQA